MIETKVMHIDHISKDDIEHVFNTHLPIAFPTETVYGLGARYDDIKTIESIYTIKGRPKLNPLIVHISDMSMLSLLTDDISYDSKRLMDHFFPGPLTLVFKKKKEVLDLVTANQDTVAVRMPESEVARQLIRLCGKPLVAPSANLSGKPSSTSIEHVLEDFKGILPLIIEGEVSRFGIESTIIDMTKFPYTILRPGVVTLSDIEKVLGKSLDQHDSSIVAPGMKYPHYQPIHPLILLKGSDEAIVSYMKEKKDVLFLGHHRFKHVITNMIDMGSTDQEMTQRLYHSLRLTASYPKVTLYSHVIENTSYMNRMLKAANYNIIEL